MKYLLSDPAGKYLKKIGFQPALLNMVKYNYKTIFSGHSLLDFLNLTVHCHLQFHMDVMAMLLWCLFFSMHELGWGILREVTCLETLCSFTKPARGGLKD